MNRRVLLACGTVLAGLAAGAWGFWPILCEDAARTEPWRLALSLTGEACATLGLLAFAWRHGVRGVPLKAGAAGLKGAGPGGGGFWWAALALVGGLLGDLAVTGSTLLEERRGHARAVRAGPVPAEAVVTRTGGIGGVNYWRFRVTFRDPAGRERSGLLDAVFRPRPSKNHPAGFEPRLPAPPGGPSPERALRAAGENAVGVRFRLPVLYDPDRPARVWAPGEGWNRGNAGHHVFLIVHLFQALAVIWAVAVLWQARGRLTGRPRKAWTIPLSPAATTALLPALPLAAEAFVLALFGLLWRLRGW